MMTVLTPGIGRMDEEYPPRIIAEVVRAGSTCFPVALGCAEAILVTERRTCFLPPESLTFFVVYGESLSPFPRIAILRQSELSCSVTAMRATISPLTGFFLARA
jgi:hypothetical protein